MQLLKAQADILPAFEKITAENWQLANAILMAAVAALTNTHSANAMRRELGRRAEGN